MRSDEHTRRSVLDAFLTHWIEDRDAGRALSVEHYQERYPDCADLVAAEFGRLDQPAEGGSVDGFLAGNGRYQRREKLAEGGMGIVYLATDRDLEREVVLKCMQPKYCGDAQQLARFEREARTTARLEHPNIVRTHDFGRTDDGYYIVMERLAGDDLDALIPEDGFDFERFVLIASQIAEGLAEAHDKGVLHRDLTPSNVKVDAGGHVKIFDFGLAKLLGEETHLTLPGVGMGKRGYWSPEQEKGRGVDERTDVYTLGVVMYEMLAGKGVLPDADGGADLNLRRGGRLLPSSIIDLITSCLAQDPARRTRSVSDVQVALRRMRASLEEEPAGGRLRTNLIIATGSLLAGVFLTVLLSGLGELKSQASEARPQGLLPAHVIQLILVCGLWIGALVQRHRSGRGLELHRFWHYVWLTFALVYAWKSIAVWKGTGLWTVYADALISNLNACAFLFAYLAMDMRTRPGVDGKRSPDFVRAALAIGGAFASLALLALIAALGMTGLPSNDAEFYFQSLPTACFIALAISLLTGRLDSKILRTPRWTVLVLYGYAIIQVAYTSFERLRSDNPTLLILIYVYAVIGKLALYYAVWRPTPKELTDYEGSLRGLLVRP